MTGDEAKRHARESRPHTLSAGLAAREEAVRLVSAVLVEHRSLDDALGGAAASQLEPRDRAFARLVAMTVLRRHGRLDAVLKGFLDKPLPKRTGRLWPILLAAAAQLLFLETPAHAAISLAVDQCRRDRAARRFDRLANALLRGITREGATRLAALDAVSLDIPGWLMSRWQRTYGEAVARRIGAAQLEEAARDLTVKIASDRTAWAERLGGRVLSTGSIRLNGGGRIADLPGFAEGAWWVQDAAAALPASLIRNRDGGEDLSGLVIADLCAAPGGKTAQLAARGAAVTAVDQSATRLERLQENLARLSLQATTVAADVAAWQPGAVFDAVLLDAPCTATGTIRRHPDILHLRRDSDIATLSDVQARLLAAASRLVKPGGTLVYCTCSLEPGEGEEQVADLLSAHGDFARRPIRAEEIGGDSALISQDSDLRTLPCHFPEQTPPGLDGFYAARLVRQA